MRLIQIILLACLSSFLSAAQVVTAAPVNFTEAEINGVKTYLHDTFTQSNACMVIGLLDESGSRTFGAGSLDNGTSNKPNGDSVFFIGSVSKIFTALLLQEADRRGEVKLDDPVAKYLPASVKMPTHSGKQITLLDLATHSAGFPINPDNMTGQDEKEQYESYTAEKMYAYLSSYKLNRDPGTEFEYSNLGMALLGHVMALRSGTDFESLVVKRIARPLKMNSTCITATPEMKSRLAMGHDASGNPSPPLKFQAYSPAGDIHSTANDLLKFLSAQVGLTSSSLTPLMEKTHVIRFTDTHGIPAVPGLGSFGRTAMDWVDRGAYQPRGMELLGHAGGAGSYHAWIGFDKKQRRGVVVLSTANDLSVEALGWNLLQRAPLNSDSAKYFAHEMVGVGFSLDKQTNVLRITKVFPNSPASKAGLVEGMIIQKIENVPTADKNIAECLKLLKANGAPKVQLQCTDAGQKVTNTVEVTRGKFVMVGR